MNSIFNNTHWFSLSISTPIYTPFQTHSPQKNYWLIWFWRRVEDAEEGFAGFATTYFASLYSSSSPSWFSQKAQKGASKSRAVRGILNYYRLIWWIRIIRWNMWWLGLFSKKEVQNHWEIMKKCVTLQRNKTRWKNLAACNHLKKC